MLRTGLTLMLAVLSLTLSGAAHAAVTVFQNPSNAPTPAAPATIVAGGANVTLNLFYQTGNTASPGCPGVPPACNRCLSGAGDEVCGWDIHISATNPSITLESFVPEAGADVVWAISGNVLRANGGVPTTGELGVHRIGALVVSAAPAGSGTVTVSGNRYASSALVAELVTTGTALATVGTAPDGDLDGIPDATDNCPTVANAGQEDGGIGPVFEAPADGVGNACDNCVNHNNPKVVGSFLSDNAWATTTGGQRDDDHDGFGNKCDADFTAGGALIGSADLTQYRASSGKSRASLTACGSPAGQRCARYDLDESGALVNSADLTVYRGLSGKAAGPKCATCPLVCASGTAVNCASPP